MPPDEEKYKFLSGITALKCRPYVEENGYCVVPNVYNSEEIDEYKKEFFNWYKNTENIEELIEKAKLVASKITLK